MLPLFVDMLPYFFRICRFFRADAVDAAVLFYYYFADYAMMLFIMLSPDFAIDILCLFFHYLRALIRVFAITSLRFSLIDAAFAAAMLILLSPRRPHTYALMLRRCFDTPCRYAAWLRTLRHSIWATRHVASHCTLLGNSAARHGRRYVTRAADMPLMLLLTLRCLMPP